MTLLTFAKAMLGDKLAKYGFEHRRNTTWVKVSDEGIYFTVGFKKEKVLEDYLVGIYFNMQPIFSKLNNTEYEIFYCYRYITNAEYMPFEIPNQTPCDILYLVEETDTRYESMLELGRKMFSTVIEPILANVHDMGSCFAANFELNYYCYRFMRSNEIDPCYHSTYNMIYTNNTFPMVLCLCKAKRYADALRLLNNCGGMSSICLNERSGTFIDFFEETTRVDAAKAWYIKMIEEGNYSEIEKTMEYWYENNCKELKTKYGLSVKYVL